MVLGAPPGTVAELHVDRERVKGGMEAVLPVHPELAPLLEAAIASEPLRLRVPR